MIRKHRIPLLVLVVLLQTAALVGMIALKQRTLMTGAPILLKTAPVDPRSLFRGDYVILNYDISRMKYADVAGDRNFKRHDEIYVVLRKGEEFWEPVSIHHEMPAHGPESVVIRGQVEWTEVWNGTDSVDGVNVRYGIENYFVPEGEGREIELPRNEDKVAIQVAVDEGGDAAIKAILIDGKARYEEKLF